MEIGKEKYWESGFESISDNIESWDRRNLEVGAAPLLEYYEYTVPHTILQAI